MNNNNNNNNNNKNIMSYHVIDFNDNIDFDYDNILIGKRISNDDETAKYYMYYVLDSPKELYIKLPKIRYIYNLVNYKYNQLNIPLYPLWDKLSKFLKFIKKNILVLKFNWFF